MDKQIAGPITGRCQCGAVSYSCSSEPFVSAHCHCLDCRAQSGTGHGSQMLVPKEAVTITGDTTAYARPADSGKTVERHFCPTCGTWVFSTSAEGAMVGLTASSLDDIELFRPQAVVYTRSRPSWDHTADEGLHEFEAMPDAEAAARVHAS